MTEGFKAVNGELTPQLGLPSVSLPFLLRTTVSYSNLNELTEQ